SSRKEEKPLDNTLKIEEETTGTRSSHADQNPILLIQLFTVTPARTGHPPPWNLHIPMFRKKNCYQGREYSASLCFSDRKFLFDYSDKNGQSIITLTVDRFRQEAPVVLEPPRRYTLDEVISLAQNRSFDTRIEYEHLIRARRSARAAYLKLLPKLNVSSTLSNLEPSITSLLGAIGDFAPFLLPSRWMQARRETHALEAEKDAMLLMRMDMGSQAEGLSYALGRDHAALALYENLLGRTYGAIQAVEPLEREGKFPEGSMDHLRAYTKWMELDVVGLKALVHQEKVDIARALGLMNPDGVEGVDVPDGVHPIHGARKVTEGEFLTTVLSRSFELRQMDHLIEMARIGKKQIYFSWLDPSESSDAGSVGFFTGDLLKIAKSQIDELLIKREQLQAVLAQKVCSAVLEWNAAVESYPIVAESMQIHERRLGRVLADIKPNSALNTLDIEAVLQDYLASGLRKAAIHAAFRVAASKLERLTLDGHYVSVPPTVEVPQALFSFEF
ncbi:MAG: hypothetical protein HYX41_05405, partial [Bdellovibrio sp.]|nr:hypothetical protein [Bdellovibrio sp.]